MTKEIGIRIKELRRSKGLTQEKLAEKINISVNYLSNIETGRDICSFTVLLGIANHLEASMDYLLGDVLKYNTLAKKDPESYSRLMSEISLLSEKEREHLIKYIELMKESRPG